MSTWMISGTLGFVAGGALIWFCKDKITSFYKTTEDQIGALEDQVRSLKARLR